MSQQSSQSHKNIRVSSSSSSSSLSSSTCHETQDTLTRGRDQLWNLERPYMLPSIVFCPLRTYVLDPTFTLGFAMLPPLTCGIYVLDHTMAVSLQLLAFPFQLLLTGTLLENNPEEDNDVRSHARTELLKGGAIAPLDKRSKKYIAYRPPSDIVSSMRGAVAFVTSTATDIVGAILNPQKLRKWMDTLTQFNSYLTATGIGEELDEAILKPLWRGRLFDNLKILNDIQELQDNWDQRLSHLSTEAIQKEKLEEELFMGHRMMRFATAAYGAEMVRSALDQGATSEELNTVDKSIAFHTQIDPEKDIVYVNVGDGGDMTTLRYFIAIDHQTKQVVMAIRGTLSISGALVDMQAMDTEFCNGGRAHQGMAEMAHQLWTHCGPKLQKLFADEKETLKDYGLCITGHSLGAGTACLLHLKIHVEQLLVEGPRKIQCYAFAPPPTFVVTPKEGLNEIAAAATTTTLVQKAMDNTVAFIHDNDCVPHLSVAAVRRLASLMDAVDNETERMWAYQRFKLFWEWSPLPSNIIDAVQQAKGAVRLVNSNKNKSETTPSGDTTTTTTTTPNKKSPCVKLEIPARIVVWMKKNDNVQDENNFQAVGCTPQDVANMDIFISQDMVTDHLPEMYEDALDAMVVVK